MLTAKIFEIKRFAVHDGDGIRTTVFFKGCPLKCKWCHNPEGLNIDTQLAFFRHKCTACGECALVCEKGAHIVKDGVHTFLRDKCVGCGKCVSECFSNALTLYGKSVSVNDLLPQLLEDKSFYDNSNGGVTLSGGECLLQADFCAELLKKLKANGVHTAVDTCGYATKADLDKVIPYTDIFLYDIKAVDSDLHKRLTGVSNDKIIENLFYLDSKGKQIEIRIPFVPDCNDGEIEKIASLLKQLKNLQKVRVLPYHNYASSKYSALDIANTLPDKTPDNFSVEQAKNLLKCHGIKVL